LADKWCKNKGNRKLDPKSAAVKNGGPQINWRHWKNRKHGKQHRIGITK
jgi:hypothetical protein